MAGVEILNFRHYERLDSMMIFALVGDGSVVFDVGGNVGYYSIALAKLRANLSIHAFEPIPSTYEQFVANAHYNGARVIINNCALFDKTGELKFYVYEQDVGNASAAIMHEEMDNKEVVCKTITLDEYAKNARITQLDFIKCDVEGAEIFALRGALESIKQYKPILFVEMLRKWAAKYHYHPNDIIALLGTLGYGCYFTRKIDSGSVDSGDSRILGAFRDLGVGLVRLEAMSDETQETNFFFLHESRHRELIDLLGKFH